SIRHNLQKCEQECRCNGNILQQCPVQEERIIPLLDWHRTTKTPLGTSQIVLSKPITLAPWNLLASCVARLHGDIYGCYRMKVILVTSVSGVNLAVLLRKSKIRKEMKVRFGAQAAAALKYLVSKGYVHKCVQASNCLITRNMTLKLADFRFAGSERCPPFIHQPLENINVAWLAPETMLRHVFSEKTDVWAFGVLLWEIFQNGAAPFHGLTNMEMRAYVIHGEARLDIPKVRFFAVKRIRIPDRMSTSGNCVSLASLDHL
ncbi:unnamed protein product, partial [Gongylonema pulchrum]|uniref:Protein kinase domain-containing protein n=1 Tax=Gongylonema pulchrum TaxID=637853 RepID=A0A183CZQ2_9BILA